MTPVQSSEANWPRPTRVFLQRRANRSPLEPKASNMSPNVGNFVHDLVEMAKAMETLPGVQRELEQARSDNSTLLDRIQRLEASIHDHKVEEERLHAKIREAEGRADQAETMFLECDDKLSAFRRLAQSFTGDLQSLVKAQEPPAPPAPEPTPASVQPEQAASDTTPAQAPVNDPRHDFDPPPASWADPSPAGVTFAGNPGNVDSVSSAPGQSEAGPTVSSQQATASQDSGLQTANAEQSVSTPSAIAADRPYYGKLYIHVPGWISREDWLAGGGDAHAYDWREGMPLPGDWVYRNGAPTFDPIKF